MTVYTSIDINAAIGHTLHLLSLITRYLALSLPFTPSYPALSFVGRPGIRPNLPFVATTKYREKNMLWMSSTAYVGKLRGEGIGSVSSKSINKHRLFLASYALLAHSIAYLAFSQGVEVGMGEPGGSSSEEMTHSDTIGASMVLIDGPAMAHTIRPMLPAPPIPPFAVQPKRPPDTDLNDPFQSPSPESPQTRSYYSSGIEPTHTLELLAALAAARHLGSRSHEPGTQGFAPHMAFSLEPGRIVEGVLRAETAKWGGKPDAGSDMEGLSEGWDVVE